MLEICNKYIHKYSIRDEEVEFFEAEDYYEVMVVLYPQHTVDYEVKVRYYSMMQKIHGFDRRMDDFDESDDEIYAISFTFIILKDYILDEVSTSVTYLYEIEDEFDE